MKFHLNLASRRYFNRQAVTTAFGVLFIGLLLLSGWSLAGIIGDQKKVRTYQLRLEEEQRKIDALRGGPKTPLTAKERKDLEGQFEVVAGILAQDNFRWTALLDRMEALVPSGVILTGLRPDYEKDRLALAGQAEDLKKMRRFLDRLLKKGGFAEVLLKNHSKVKVKDYANREREAIAFSIELEGVF